MAKLTSIVLISSLVMAFVLLSSSPAMSQEVGILSISNKESYKPKSQEVEDESEFNYDEKSDKGPQNWGNIKPEWFMCKNGTKQSPIDISNKSVQIVSNLGTLQINYKPSNATLKNRGHDIELKFKSNSNYLQINGTLYVLKQLHWHSPSEHTIDGKRFDLELHLVHQTPSGKIAVIGIVYKIGTPDPFLSLLKKDLEAISKSNGAEREVGKVDPNLIAFDRRQYYRYIGSLTIPPCSENVTWTIVKEVKFVSKEQIDLLRNAVHDESNSNARPLQPLNGRLVQLNKL